MKKINELPIINTDEFLDLPLSAQALYFHLLFRELNEIGEVVNIHALTRYVKASEEDLKILIDKDFLIELEEEYTSVGEKIYALRKGNEEEWLKKECLQ